MRLLKRGRTESEQSVDGTNPPPVLMTGKRVRGVQTPETPVLEGSARLARIEERLAEQHELLNGFESEFRHEASSLVDYSGRQQSNLERVLQHVEKGLRPLREYAAAEEANLRRLSAEMQARPASFITTNFDEYVTSQESGIRMTQRSIEHQREPFIEYFDSQGEALEVALARFDSFVERLEASIETQRDILAGLLEAARDEEFQEVRRYLYARQEIWESYIARGAEDPREAYRELADLRTQFTRESSGNAHAREVLEHTAAADERLRDMVKATPSAESLVEAAAQRRASAAAAAEVLRAADAGRDEETRWVDIGPSTLADARYSARAS